MRHTIPVSLAYKFAFMLSFVAVLKIPGYGEFQLSHLKWVWMVRKLRVVIWTHAFFWEEERKKCSAFLESILNSHPSLCCSPRWENVTDLLPGCPMMTITRPLVLVVKQLYFVPSECVWRSFLCDSVLFRIEFWCINKINPSNNIGPWFDYGNKIICTWSQKCFIKYLHLLLRRMRMYSYFMKLMLCF